MDEETQIRTKTMHELSEYGVLAYWGGKLGSKKDKVLKDKISYTINYIITPKDRTLEASDIEKFSSRLIEHMKKIGVELRS